MPQMPEKSETPEMVGTVTQWLKPRQPLAVWWQRNYPGLREVSRELAVRVRDARSTHTTHTTSQRSDPHGIATPYIPSSPSIPSSPVDTPGLRYYDYGLLGGAIDYRMRMEFTRQWGGDPERSAFTRAWGGKRGSLAHAAAGLLVDCAPALAQAGPPAAQLAESLPALADLLEERAANLDELAPWDWSGQYATSQREEAWVLNYCIVLAELDNFYRSWGARFDFTPLLSPSGYRGAQYASGHAGRSDFWGTGPGGGVGAGRSEPGRAEGAESTITARQRDAAVQIVNQWC